MSDSFAPLRFGFPDVTLPEGRAIAGKLVNGELKVRGPGPAPGRLSR